MCGICGCVEREPGVSPRESTLDAMAAALAHRGPDGQATVVLGPVGLGHRRLAIVNRGPGGAQPMTNPERTVWVVYNGEIYNYLDERRDLERRGRQFRSNSDTEVLMRLYEEYGEACLARLHGMFAFGIWDARERKLILARDRFGKKPLFYRQTPRQFSFASEIKALLAAGVAPEIDPQALHHFLAFDYVPSPGTAFRGIAKLLPGHALVLQHDRLRIEPFVPPPRARDRSAGATPTPARIREALGTAVDRRLIGEVPVGVFLSGGIDSSAIVALLAARHPHTVRTFSVGFREASHDERPMARLVATQFRTEHHEFEVDARVSDLLPAIVRHYDEPFGDPSAVPTYVLARGAGRHITVALTGDGGDEIFAGYERYRKHALTAMYLRLPRIARRLAASATAWPASLVRRFEHPLRQAARFAAMDSADASRIYPRWLLHLDADDRGTLCTPEFLSCAHEDAEALVDALFARSSGATAVDRALEVDLASYLPDDLMTKMDMATMAHSVEARCPFLDRDVVAMTASLDARDKLRGLRSKHVLRRAMVGLLPRQVLTRAKRGFGLPLRQWFAGELRPLVHEVILGSTAMARGYFRPGALRRLVQEHESGERDRQYLLWNLLVLELWHQQVVEGATGTATP